MESVSLCCLDSLFSVASGSFSPRLPLHALCRCHFPETIHIWHRLSAPQETRLEFAYGVMYIVACMNYWCILIACTANRGYWVHYFVSHYGIDVADKGTLKKRQVSARLSSSLAVLPAEVRWTVCDGVSCSTLSIRHDPLLARETEDNLY